MALPLFNFRLRDWEKVEPWTFTDGTKSLSWFGFTDGWYWINCGNDELFRYASNLPADWSGMESPYCDYQVARLWEDVLQILPRVLEPVPEDLAVILADKAECSRWEQQHRAWFESDADLELIDNEAFNWVFHRFLDAGYLVQCPKIMFWRVGNVVYIRWDNSERKVDGLSIWAAGEGTYRMSVQDFLSEIESFHNRFMAAMRDRVNSIAAGWNRPDVQLDFERLVEEQSERESALREAFESQHETDWDSVREGRRILDRFQAVAYA